MELEARVDSPLPSSRLEDFQFLNVYHDKRSHLRGFSALYPAYTLERTRKACTNHFPQHQNNTAHYWVDTSALFPPQNLIRGILNGESLIIDFNSFLLAYTQGLDSTPEKEKYAALKREAMLIQRAYHSQVMEMVKRNDVTILGEVCVEYSNKQKEDLRRLPIDQNRAYRMMVLRN